MNISTGLYRLAQVIKWGGRILGGFLLLGLVIDFLTSTPQRQSDMSSDRIVVLILVVGFIAITGVIAWVLEGFSDD
jgi:hypothetical protein